MTSQHAGLSRLFVAALVVFVPAMARAQGGPPLMTDDPDTPGPGYWEINIATLLDRTMRTRTLEVPRVDVNYGVGRRIQLKFEMPWVRLRDEDRSVETGAGSATAGVKWRMVGQEGTKLAWSIYPQLSFRTASASVDKGISEKGSEFLMPTEVTVEMSHVEINGEIGRAVVSGAPGRWIYGISTEGHVAPRLELLAELHGEQLPENATARFLTAGARYKLTTTMILMGAVGRTVQNSDAEGARFYLYSGLQLNLPGRFVFEQARPAGPRPAQCSK
jgi:hypothetical protein